MIGRRQGEDFDGTVYAASAASEVSTITRNNGLKIRLAIIVAFTAFAVMLVCMFVAHRFFEEYAESDYEQRADFASKEAVAQIGDDCFIYDAGSGGFDYNESKRKLDGMRILAGANSFYFIKVSGSEPVYALCSFDSYKDCYVPGSKVDEEIRQASEQALSGKFYFDLCNVSAQNKSFEQAYVYIAPVYDEKRNIIGAVGMEFSAKGFFTIVKLANRTVVPSVCVIALIMVIASFLVMGKAGEKMIKEVIYTDNLTGFKNRLAYEKKIERLNLRIKNNIGDDPLVGIIMYDLNDLKVVNDSLGHLAGDKYIKDSAAVIENCFGEYGTTYRVGGDEFVTVVRNNSPEVIGDALVEFELQQEKYNIDNDFSPFIMSVSVGYDYFVPGTDLNLTSVIKRADDKMYKVKRDKKRKFDRSPR